MAAYLVLMQQVHGMDRYREEYLPGLRPFVGEHGGEVLGAGLGAEPAWGEPPDSTVVLGFGGAAAWGLLNDPGYQPVKDIGFSITSRGHAVVAPGFSPAGSAAR